MHQSVLGRPLNFGTVELSCAGSDGSGILIENVYAPEVVKSVIESRMLEMRGASAFRRVGSRPSVKARFQRR